MGVCQIIMIVIMGMSLGESLVQHGETKIKKYNFWAALMAAGIEAALLYFGGFFG